MKKSVEYSKATDFFCSYFVIRITNNKIAKNLLIIGLLSYIIDKECIGKIVKKCLKGIINYNK